MQLIFLASRNVTVGVAWLLFPTSTPCKEKKAHLGTTALEENNL